MSRRAWIFICLMAAGLIAWFGGAGQFLQVETLLASRETLGLWVDENFAASLVLFFAAYTLLALFCVPASAFLRLASGFLFGATAGVVASVLAATASGFLLFLATRAGLGDAKAGRATPVLARIGAGFRANAISYMLFLRIMPVFPFWLVNIAAALAGVRLTTFVWTTFVGVVPAALIFASAGAGLDALLDARQVALETCTATGTSACTVALGMSDVLTPQVYLSLGALALAALVPVALKHAARRWGNGVFPIS